MRNLQATLSIEKSSTSRRPRVAQTSEEVIREWLARFALNCGQPPSDGRVLLWIDELRGIEPTRLVIAFRAVLQSHTFNSIPQIGEVHTQLSRAESHASDLQAEQAWNFAIDYVMRHYHPDVGIYRNAPEMPPRLEHSISAAGGLHWLATCPEDQLSWAKKAFTAAYENISRLERTQELLPSGSEAKGLLRKLSASAKTTGPKNLPSPNNIQPHKPLCPDDPIRAEFAALRQRLDAPDRTSPNLSADEFERRKQIEKARFKCHLEEHPELLAIPVRQEAAAPKGTK